MSKEEEDEREEALAEVVDPMYLLNRADMDAEGEVETEEHAEYDNIRNNKRYSGSMFNYVKEMSTVSLTLLHLEKAQVICTPETTPDQPDRGTLPPPSGPHQTTIRTVQTDP